MGDTSLPNGKLPGINTAFAATAGPLGSAGMTDAREGSVNEDVQSSKGTRSGRADMTDR